MWPRRQALRALGASLALPALTAHAHTLDFYVEARAPSGYVLARDGSEVAPLRVRLDAAPAARAQRHETPLRRTWWLWTSVAIAVAGIGITGALLAH